MQRAKTIAALLVLLGALFPGVALGQSAFAQSSIEDAVVLVRAGITDPINHGKQSFPEGSGFLIDLQGHIITARHVILKDDTDWERAGRWVSVALRHREATPVSADIVYCEPGNVDLCLIRVSRAAVSASGIGSFFLPSCRHLRSGERIEALGYSMGSKSPVHIGEARITGEVATGLKYPSNIQISPGMSGGPVLDAGGNVVAVNFGAVRGFPTSTFVQPLIYGEGLFRRAGVACPTVVPVAPHAPVAPPCNGVEVEVGSAGEKQCIRPGSGQSFRDCPDCPEMVVVPEGSFMMGSTPDEIEALVKEYNNAHYRSEGPQRKVTIPRPFAVGKYEVTFAEWDACVAAGGCLHNPHDGVHFLERWGRANRPVIDVSWNDINREYLPWLSRKAGKKVHRLLTEAEWEYAARAGTTTPYAFGSTITRGHAQFYPADKTAEVASFQPNAFGIYDMHGNVEEWVEDCWNASYNGAPLNGSAWTVGDCSRRVLRGGTWGNRPPVLRSAYRAWNPPDFRRNNSGFRLARTL